MNAKQPSTRFGWTQPLCEQCWELLNPLRTPTRLRKPFRERCARCGIRTISGIYTRMDPATVDFPKEKETGE